MEEERSGKDRRSGKERRRGGTTAYDGPERRSLNTVVVILKDDDGRLSRTNRAKK